MRRTTTKRPPAWPMPRAMTHFRTLLADTMSADVGDALADSGDSAAATDGDAAAVSDGGSDARDAAHD